MTTNKKEEIRCLVRDGKAEPAAKYAYGSRGIIYRREGPVDLSAEYTLYGYKGSQNVVVIPSKIGKTPITAIGVPDRHKVYTQAAFWDVDTIVVSEGIRELNYCAFSIVNKLKHIYLPDSLEYVAEDALLYHTGTTVYCSKGNTLAQKIAKEHDFACILLDE